MSLSGPMRIGRPLGRWETKRRSRRPRWLPDFMGRAFRAVPQYISEANITEHVQEGDTVFLGVDNHKTRKVVSDYCEKLATVTLISGGNDFNDGNVQVHIREGGRDWTVSITRYQPGG